MLILLLSDARIKRTGWTGQFFLSCFSCRKLHPLRKISRQQMRSRGIPAAKDVWSILDEDEVLPEKPDAIPLKPLQNAIELRHVSFRYDNDPSKKILDDVSLDIPKGTMVALVGESGGGKSSLIRLIQRLYDPSS